jgi:hypothetical protein
VPTKRDVPYIWVTWLASLLSGDNHCEWAAWFRAHFHHLKRPSSFDEVKWRADHGEMLRTRVPELQKQGYRVFIEHQNGFNLKGRAATVGGTPDIVAIGEQDAWVIDCKSGKQKDSHYFQVLIYMLMLPITHPACRGRSLGGEIQYRDYSSLLMPGELTEHRQAQIRAMIERIGAKEPLIKVPSPQECRWCPVASHDCPERMDGPAPDVIPEHDLF